MAVAIAAQACLPVLRLGLRPYDGFVGIVVHPDEVQVRREFVDDDGVVHEYDDVLAGEAMEGGPVMLSWRDVSGARREFGPGATTWWCTSLPMCWTWATAWRTAFRPWPRPPIASAGGRC